MTTAEQVPNPPAEKVIGVAMQLAAISLGQTVSGSPRAGDLARYILRHGNAASSLSEGAPSEEPLGDTVFQFGDDAQAYRAWQAIVDAIPQEVQSDWEAIDYLRTLIRWTLGSPAGVSPQEATGEQVADDDLPDEHLPNQAYKVGRKIAERGDFNGLDAATVFMRGAVYGVRKLAPLDPVKVAEVLNRHEPIFKDGLYAGRCICGFEHPIYSGWRLHRSGALCEAYTEGKLA